MQFTLQISRYRFYRIGGCSHLLCGSSQICNTLVNAVDNLDQLLRICKQFCNRSLNLLLIGITVARGILGEIRQLFDILCNIYYSPHNCH